MGASVLWATGCGVPHWSESQPARAARAARARQIGELVCVDRFRCRMFRMWGSCEGRGVAFRSTTRVQAGGFSDGGVCSDSAASTDRQSLGES